MNSIVVVVLCLDLKLNVHRSNLSGCMCVEYRASTPSYNSKQGNSSCLEGKIYISKKNKTFRLRRHTIYFCENMHRIKVIPLLICSFFIHSTQGCDETQYRGVEWIRATTYDCTRTWMGYGPSGWDVWRDNKASAIFYKNTELNNNRISFSGGPIHGNYHFYHHPNGIQPRTSGTTRNSARGFGVTMGDALQNPWQDNIGGTTPPYAAGGWYSYGSWGLTCPGVRTATEPVCLDTRPVVGLMTRASHHHNSALTDEEVTTFFARRPDGVAFNEKDQNALFWNYQTDGLHSFLRRRGQGRRKGGREG